MIPIKKIKKKLTYLICGLWAIPINYILILVEPLIEVRFAIIPSSRIGHFMADASVFLAMKKRENSKKKQIYLFAFEEYISNAQWEIMVKRQLYVSGWVKYLVFYSNLLFKNSKNLLLSPTRNGDRKEYEILLKKDVERFEFTDSENRKCRDWLRSNGIMEDGKFVCIHVRDSTYLEATNKKHEIPANYSYHDYRNSDIDSYVTAIKMLIENGYHIIRLGAIVSKPINFKHPNLIDYPFTNNKDSMLDIWLPLNCAFMISTASGIDSIPLFYGKPMVLYVNALPLFLSVTPIEHMWVPKHLIWPNKKHLTLKEHCENYHTSNKEYEAKGISINDLSEREILLAVEECMLRVSNKWVDCKEDVDLMAKYWDIFSKAKEFNSYHGSIHPNARVGLSWLKSMGDEFLE